MVICAVGTTQAKDDRVHARYQHMGWTDSRMESRERHCDASQMHFCLTSDRDKDLLICNMHRKQQSG